MLKIHNGYWGRTSAVAAQPNNRKRRWLPPNLPTLLLVVAVGLSLLALYVALRESVYRRKNEGGCQRRVTNDEAEEILARANDTAAFVGNLLGFLEATFAVISLGLVAGAWMLRAMILDQVEETRDFVERTEKQLEERGAHLDQLERM
jgi:hypothetical protein